MRASAVDVHVNLRARRRRHGVVDLVVGAVVLCCVVAWYLVLALVILVTWLAKIATKGVSTRVR